MSLKIALLTNYPFVDNVEWKKLSYWQAMRIVKKSGEDLDLEASIYLKAVNLYDKNYKYLPSLLNGFAWRMTELGRNLLIALDKVNIALEYGDDLQILDTKAEVLWKLGRTEEALEVINKCIALDMKTPIMSVHDIGAGGLSNAIPEIVNESDKGAEIRLSNIQLGEESMTPLEIWCNESQERYVIILKNKDKKLFDSICNIENCPYSIIGKVTDKQTLLVYDIDDSTKIIDLPMQYLLGKPPIKPITINGYKNEYKTIDFAIRNTINAHK